MLIFAIIFSIILVIIGLIVPILSNITTPKNLYRWYFNKQALTLWGMILVSLIIVWVTYIFLK